MDLHIFSAPLGTAASDFEFLDDTLIALLPPPNHAFDENVGIVPGDPHAPPYGHELGDGVTSNGFHENGPFSVPEFTSPNAIWLAMMNIPEDPPAALGSSPDFNSGPIIPNDIFPILASGSTTHDGELFSEPFSDVSIPGPNDLGFDVEGHSHFPQFMIENTEFRTEPDPEPAGGYTLHLEMIDQDGDGWQIDASFVVGCTIIGTPGNDALSGTSGNDIICGLGGNDSIVGGNGNDIIRGGTGNDNISGGNGNDTISGGAGNDTISGGNGSDNIRSGSDNDTAEGGNGEDTLNSVDGVSGNDRNSGGPGNDTCTDDPGDVTIC